MKKPETFQPEEAIETEGPSGPIVDHDLFVSSNGEPDMVTTTVYPDGSIEQEGIGRFMETVDNTIADLNLKSASQS